MPYKIPFPSRISDELFPMGTTVDLMLYDDTILDGWVVPDGIERDLVIATLLFTHGKTPLYHPDPEYIRSYIKTWSLSRVESWTRIYKAMTAEYNPIENVDRHELITETRTVSHDENTEGSQKQTTTTSGSSSDNSTVEGTSDDTTTVSVSAENSDDFQPQNQTVDNRADKTSQETNSSTDTETTGEGTTKSKTTYKDTDTFTHKNETHGNIGVTTNQQMITAELELRKQNVVQIIVDAYRDAFCLDIY